MRVLSALLLAAAVLAGCAHHVTRAPDASACPAAAQDLLDPDC